MSASNEIPGRLNPHQRGIVSLVSGLLQQIGSANDAEDHGYREDAEQMRAESCASLRVLLDEHEFLCRLLPTLRWELDTQHILGFGWADLYRAAVQAEALGGEEQLNDT